jgi:hypothetical protein
VGALPDLVAAGGTAELHVQLRAGREKGVRKAGFLVSTDDEARRVLPYELVATLVPMLEVLGGDSTSLAIGETGRLSLEVVCRRQGKLGLVALSEVRVDDSIGARLVGSPEVGMEPSEVIRSTSRVELDLPASSEPGAHAAELLLIWPDTEERWTIRWSVRPALRASPSAIVVRQGAAPLQRQARVESDGVPFRVLRIDGVLQPVNLDRPGHAAARHDLTMELDARKPGLSDLIIRTDHPAQPVVKITVMVQPSDPVARGGEEDR